MQQQQPAPPQIDIGAILQQISMKDPRQRTPMDMSFLAWVQGGGKGPPPMIQVQQQRQKPMLAQQTALTKHKKAQQREQQQLHQRTSVQPQSLQQQIANRKKPVNKRRTETKKQNVSNLASENKRFHEFEHELALVTKSPESNAPTPPSTEAQNSSSPPNEKFDSTKSRPLHPEMEKKEARKHLVDAMNRRLGMNMSNLGTYSFH